MNVLRGRTIDKIKVLENEPPPINDLSPLPEAESAAVDVCDREGGGEYIANLHTGEVHNASDPCAWVHLITDEHRQYVSGLPEGFDWCGHCRIG